MYSFDVINYFYDFGLSDILPKIIQYKNTIEIDRMQQFPTFFGEKIVFNDKPSFKGIFSNTQITEILIYNELKYPEFDISKCKLCDCYKSIASAIIGRPICTKHLPYCYKKADYPLVIRQHFYSISILSKTIFNKALCVSISYYKLTPNGDYIIIDTGIAKL